MDYSTYHEFPNLVGVFRARLPIAISRVNGQDDETVRVGYYGDDYLVVGKPTDGSALAFRVFQIPARAATE